MAITKVSNSGVNGSKYDIVSADNYYMEPIATTLLGSTATTITFSNIPQGYKHLQVRFLARCNQSGVDRINQNMTFNSDTTASYSMHFLYGDGSSASATAYTSSSYIYTGLSDVTAATAPANTFGIGVIDILDYANTSKYKTTRTLSGQDQNSTSGRIFLGSGNWRNTAAITSITFTAESSSSYVQNTRFSLYGIKG